MIQTTTAAGRLPVVGFDIRCRVFDNWSQFPAINAIRQSCIPVGGEKDEQFTFEQRLHRAKGQFMDGVAIWENGKCVRVTTPTFPEMIFTIDSTERAHLEYNGHSFNMERRGFPETMRFVGDGLGFVASLMEIRIEIPDLVIEKWPEPQHTWAGGNWCGRPCTNAYGCTLTIHWCMKQAVEKGKCTEDQKNLFDRIDNELVSKYHISFPRCADFLCNVLPIPSEHLCSMPIHTQDALMVVTGILVGRCKWYDLGRTVLMEFRAPNFPYLRLNLVFRKAALVRVQEQMESTLEAQHQDNCLGTLSPAGSTHDVHIQYQNGMLTCQDTQDPAGFYVETPFPEAYRRRIQPLRACKKQRLSE